MARSKRMERRKFLKAAAGAALTTTIPSCAGKGSPWRFFTEEEGKTAEAICEQLIPSDKDPGAAWAGVVNYIDLQLQGPYGDYRETYRLGLAGVDRSSESLFGERFIDLKDEERIKVLALLEKDEAPGDGWKKVAAKGFFDLILDHALQGFYGDPRHGGNWDGASWKMLGVPYPPLRGRERNPLG